MENIWTKIPVTSLSPGPEDSSLVLVGQGQFLILVDVDTGVVKDRCQVFRGAVVHNIEQIDRSRYLVRGGKSVSIVTVDDCKVTVEVSENVSDDWIIASAVHSDNIWMLSAHNKLTRSRVSDLTRVEHVYDANCGPCILYSGYIHSTYDRTFIMSGTVFGKVLIWNSDTGVVVNSLEGHDGVLFSVNYADGYIVTTSDDRSSIVYSVTDSNTFTEVQRLYRLYGHSYRVFRSLLSVGSQRVFTGGEDGLVISWNLQTGVEEDRMEANGGSPVWSITRMGTGSIITGGGDGSVALSSFDQDKNTSAKHINGIRGKPRSVKSHGNNMLIMDDEGHLYHYSPETDETCLVYSDNRLASYSLLETSGNHVAMCGLAGDVIIGTLSGDCQTLTNVSSKQLFDGKIFSSAVFSGGSVMVCDNRGNLVLADRNLEMMASGELPQMKDRWFTVGRKVGDIFVVGDRCGGVHFYKTNESDLCLVDSYMKVHGRHGVTDLYVDGDDKVWSSGRDGKVSCYSVSGDKVQVLQTVMVAHTWVGGVRRLGDQLAVILWHGTQLVVRSLGGDTQLASVQAGGGHRSWDMVGDNGLVYIKDGHVVIVDKLVDGHRRLLIPGGHTQQINVVTQCQGYILTGSEDTYIRVYRDNQEMAVLRGHLSSIKCLHLVTDNTTGHMLLVSGGGRAELRLWRLVIDPSGLYSTPVTSVMLREGGGGKGVKKALKVAQSETVLDGETRFMDIDSIWEDEDNLLLYVACSDSYVRVYKYSKSQNTVILVRQAIKHSHCLLQLKLVPDSNILITGTTGGHLTVWDRDKLDVVTEINVHQSGVNSVDVKHGDDGDLVIVTGGDDTKLVVTRYRDGHLTPVWTNDTRSGHATQITGVRILGDHILTCGVDQRLILWRLNHGDQVTWVTSKCVSVADISHMDAWMDGGDTINIVLVGVGMERLQFKLFYGEPW